MIPDVAPSPQSDRTLPTSRSAFGATPWFAPSLAAPDPPTVDATCVPCPWPSCHDPDSVKPSPATMRPCRSGCSASAPESRIATVAPVPSKPADQAPGASTCAVDWSSVDSTFRSSQSFSIEPAARLRGSVRSAQNAVAVALSSVSATLPMDSRTTPVSAPRGATVGSAGSAYSAIRGRVALRASS
jgi:hypothetical protein